MRSWQITCGGLSKQQLLLQLASRKIAMNAYATWLFLEIDFVSEEQQLYLQQVTPRSLGFTAPTTYLEFKAAALAQGFLLCPWYTAIYLRLQWMEPLELRFTVVCADEGRDVQSPRGFYLQYYSDQYWLRGYRSSEDWLLALDEAFVFRHAP